MRELVIYIHGKGGSAAEAEHYGPLFSGREVIGFEYNAQTPWEAQKEFSQFYDEVSKEFDSVSLIANSIGAYFAMHGLRNKKFKIAYFISPIVNMEKLIADMMVWAGVTEEELAQKGTIETAFDETLSYSYLQWVRNNPISWHVLTKILYGSKDHLQTFETVSDFAKKIGAPITVMQGGEHWFHTKEQMAVLDSWITE